MSEFRVELSGEEARFGVVAASDVAVLIIGVERALSRAASVKLGRPKMTTGRYEQVIAQSVRLTLRAVEGGSIVPVFEIPDAAPLDAATLEIDAPSLGETALTELLAAADPQSSPHPVVAKALLELADSVRVGERYDAMTFDARTNGRRRKVRVDGGVRQQLRQYVDSVPAPPTRSDAVVGVLVEADFEKGTARLRTATDPAVTVTFEGDLADDIQVALRQHATFRGEVVYDRKTNVAKSVRLQRVDRGEQLVLGVDSEEFWRARSFGELAQLQGAGEPVDPEDLYDPDATDKERDAFMAAIAELD